MAKRRFRPEDGLRLITATDPDLSPDGRRVHIVRTPSEAVDFAERILHWNQRHDARRKKRARA
jgi:hypothetical protein